MTREVIIMSGLTWIIAISVIVFLAVAGSLVAIWWWRLADRWLDYEHKRFKNDKPKDEPETIVISKRGERRDEDDSPERDA